MPSVRHRPPTRSKSAAVRLAALYPSRRQLRRWNREQRVHRVLVGGLIGLVALVVLVLGFGYYRENVMRASETAAVVNGETITLEQVLERVKPRAAALDAQARFYQMQGLAQAAAQVTLQRSGLPDQVLDSMIEDRLVAAELEKRGISVTDAEVDEAVRKEIAEQEALSNPPTPTPSPAAEAAASPEAAAAAASPSPTMTPAGPTPTSTAVPTLATDEFEAAYQKFLDRAGLSKEAYRELKRAELARDKLRDDIAKNVPRTEEMVHARHILVDNEDSLKQVQEKLAAGTPFDQVAAEFSTDPGSREKGGDLGWFPRGQMNAPFEAAAFSQPIGDIGEPVQSPNGYHIIQVLEKDPEHPLTPQQIEGKASQAYQAWYAGVRNGENVKNELTPEGRAWILRQVRAANAGNP
ncbi:MAG: peptidylprolyl isomerase [Chloroflexota bacterium]